MTIHVSATELQARIAELLEAARRGEEIVIDEAGGMPVRMLGVVGARADQRTDDDVVRRAAKRASAFGMYAHLIGDGDIDVRALKQTDAQIEADWTRKFGPPR